MTASHRSEAREERRSASVIAPMETFLALGLLAKGCLRDILGAPLRAFCKHILLPLGIVCFVAFLDTGPMARGRWPMLAIAGAVWLLFANSVNHGGMTLWHERWLLRHPGVPAGLLLTAAALVPIGLFGLHLSLIRLALRVSTFHVDGTPVELAFAGGIAVSAGLGTGILAARFSALRPNFVFAVPRLLLASLFLTPVFYRLSSLDGLDGLGYAWSLANPLCVATELARAGISVETDALPRYAKIIACALSGGILCWGLLTLRTPSTSFAEEHA
jgi:ABC-type polysaccharide/polyol phosphate export permease